MFSNYKNTQTGKALVRISPHGGGILFSDIYPGSISDSKLTDVVQFNGKKVRNWGILNSIWQIYRTDILTSAWQTIALIVDLINPLIGPKE